MGQSAFNGCRSLTSADLRSATTVGASAFNGCESLQTVDLPKAISVGDYAFHGCGSLMTADLPSATYVGKGAFSDSDALTFARFSDELESVGSHAFSVSFYSGSEQLAADAGSLRGRTFTGSGDGKLYESFEISWLDDAGALADTTFARKGETPSHDGLTKEPTDRYTYEFAGWSPEPEPAVKEASYTAVFDAAARAYPVQVSASPYGYGTVSLSEVADVPYGTAVPDDLAEDMRALNSEIASELGKEFMVGHCVFIGGPASEAVEREVLPYLRDIWAGYPDRADSWAARLMSHFRQ